jgi:hypothetical protein
MTIQNPADASAASSPVSLDAMIAAMAGEVNDSPDVDDSGKVVPTDSEESTEEETPVEDSTPVETEEPSEEEEEPTKPSAIDGKKLAEAIEKRDLAALLEAIGDEAADEMLGSKAHKTLRLQVKDLVKAQKAAASTMDNAKLLAEKLDEKYRDPISTRKAAEAGNVDAVIDAFESWSGKPWADLQRWIAKGLGGRPERLAAKAKEQTKATVEQTAEQQKALAETKTWVEGVVKKVDAKLLEAVGSDVVDLVIEEIRSGLAKGVDSPTKALPLIKGKLKTRYENLHKYFGERKAKKTPPPVVAAKAGRSEGKSTRSLTLEELIAETKKEAGIR